eukprot:763340-Hanusia_phi.AAC.6
MQLVHLKVVPVLSSDSVLSSWIADVTQQNSTRSSSAAPQLLLMSTHPNAGNMDGAIRVAGENVRDRAHRTVESPENQSETPPG